MKATISSFRPLVQPYAQAGGLGTTGFVEHRGDTKRGLRSNFPCGPSVDFYGLIHWWSFHVGKWWFKLSCACVYRYVALLDSCKAAGSCSRSSCMPLVGDSNRTTCQKVKYNVLCPDQGTCPSKKFDYDRPYVRSHLNFIPRQFSYIVVMYHFAWKSCTMQCKWLCFSFAQSQHLTTMSCQSQPILE